MSGKQGEFYLKIFDILTNFTDCIGLQLSANQDEVETKETFQLEIDANSEKVYLRNDQDKYWRVTGSSIQADATSKR